MHVGFAGVVIEVQPLAVFASHYALCTKHGAVFDGVGKLREYCAQLIRRVRLCSFHAPAFKHLVGVVVMSAAAALAVLVVMFVLVLIVLAVVVVVTAVTVVFVFVLFVVVVMAAVTVVVLVLLFVILVIVVVPVTAFERVCPELFHLGFERVAVLHCRKYLAARKLLPGSGDKGSLAVVRADEFHGVFELGFARNVGVGEDYAVGGFNLVIEEFAEVLHIHFALCGVYYGGIGVYCAVLQIGAVYGADYVGELAYTRRLNQDSVGVVLFAHLFERLGEVAHKRTADTARIEFVYLYAGVGEEAAVYADVAEFVFNEHEFFARVGLFYQFFDERSLACAQKARKDIDFCHRKTLP